MRLGAKPLGFVVNFLLGVAWAFVLIGALTSFLTFSSNSFLFALFAALLGTLPGLLGVIFLENIITNKEKLEELKKQTKLLQQILDQNK